MRVLPPMTIDHSSWDPARRQYIAEDLYEQIKRDHADLAEDPNAYLIGFTDADMYSVWYKWPSSFTQRDRQRAAVISAQGLQDLRRWPNKREDPATANQHFQARLHRILLKDVAMLYWHLPANNDPTSLLHATLNFNVKTEDLWESDLNPAATPWGEYEGEPCIFFNYSSKNGIHPLPGQLIRTCASVEDPDTDGSVEQFQVDLRLGLLITKHTDVSLPGTIPIRFQRALRDGWGGPDAFGLTGTDSYDSYLASADNIRIDVIHDDGGRYALDRRPRWLPFLAAVRYVDEDYSGSLYEMRWSTAAFPHYELKRYNGDIETYLPCLGVDVNVMKCYLDGYRNAQGQELKFERNDRRKLVQLTSPEKNWVRVTHGPN
ncbi:MAG: DUF6531 domain-containing protein, partial [Acidobacteriaceae bacterium]